MAQEITQMDLKNFFLTILAILFTPRRFWQEYSFRTPESGENLQKDYALPVIAMVQLMKFPIIGTPRLAMFNALATVVLDIAALYLITGVMLRLLERERIVLPETAATALAAFSLTPIWLAEPFYFLGGFSWLIAAVATGWAIRILGEGMRFLFERHPLSANPPQRNAALLIAVVSAAIFLVQRSFHRLIDTIPV
jgi:hypothetical protein